MSATSSVTIRRSRPADEAALVRLAALDSQRPLTGERIVAEDRGAIRAALALDGGRVVADPFASTADEVALLRLRAERLHAPARHRRTIRRVRPLAAR